MLRKRKTKDPCPGCSLNKALCVCEWIPRLELRTRVALIVHAKELKRTTNTGRLAIQSLVNSSMHIRGEGREALDLSGLLSPNYRSVVVFPSEDAVDLAADFVAQSPVPIQLIVPDGNWRQASKVPSRHEELKDLPRVKISAVNEGHFHLRAESSPEGMSTLEAIAQALKIIEGEAAFAPLMALYQAKLSATLIGRAGQVASAKFTTA
jgi:DTW domain-containing protein